MIEVVTKINLGQLFWVFFTKYKLAVMNISSFVWLVFDEQKNYVVSLQYLLLCKVMTH